MDGSAKLNGHLVEIYALEEVERHNTVDDCWVVQGKDVYDVTPFLEKHPGGAELILNEAGKDITNVLRDENFHVHTANAYTMLKEYKIGEVEVGTNYSTDDKQLDINENELPGFKEELVDWNRGMVFQVHKFGREYIKWVHTPVNRKCKMFDNTFVEFFSNTRWWVVPLVWIPTTIITALIGIQRLVEISSDTESLINVSVLLASCFYLAMGAFLWTFIEYVLHKYLFHMEPNGDSPVQITIHFFFHGLHHKVPFDEGRLVFPPTVAAIFTYIYWYILNANFSYGVDMLILSGGIAGYICYDMIHYYIHHGNTTKGTYLDDMKHYHVRHHFVDSNDGFGISSKLWDIVFDVGKSKFL